MPSGAKRRTAAAVVKKTRKVGHHHHQQQQHQQVFTMPTLDFDDAQAALGFLFFKF